MAHHQRPELDQPRPNSRTAWVINGSFSLHMATILCHQGQKMGQFADSHTHGSSAGQELRAESSEIGYLEEPPSKECRLAWRLARGHAGYIGRRPDRGRGRYLRVSGLPSHPPDGHHAHRRRTGRRCTYLYPAHQDGRRPEKVAIPLITDPGQNYSSPLWANLGRRSPGCAAHPIRSGSVHRAFPFSPKSSPVPSPIQFSKLPTSCTLPGPVSSLTLPLQCFA